MDQLHPDGSRKEGGWIRAVQFWEPRRLWYNGLLTLVVLLWLLLTWPHFRPALTLVALGRMMVLALLANVAYSFAYGAEFFFEGIWPRAWRRRFRSGVLVLGMLGALVLENYWIADEIYPDVPPQAAVHLAGAASAMGTPALASNMNFPAPLAILGFLGACGGLFFGIAAVLIFWFARKPKFARLAAFAIAIGAAIYFALLFGFSAGSRDTSLGRGQEKYFCEIDCHLAYSIVDVKTEPGPDSTDYWITLRTRFDGATTSSRRPKDAPLTPSPREARLVDAGGREYRPLSTAGSSLLTPIKPSDSYTTQLGFRVPSRASGLRLLLSTIPAWPDHLVIGDENSWWHKKTYFGL
jgi:hypothetical protein